MEDKQGCRCNSAAEVFFLSSATNQSNNIDIKPIVFDVLKDSYVLIHFSKKRDDSLDSIKKETAFSLLVTLCHRIRVFSFVKNKAQIYKIQKSPDLFQLFEEKSYPI